MEKMIYVLVVLLLTLYIGFKVTFFVPRMLHHYVYLDTDHAAEFSNSQENSVDLLVFTYDRPLQLYAFLESASKNISGIGQLHVLYRTSNDTYERGYDVVKEDFPDVVFHRQSRLDVGDFKKMVIEVTEQSPSDYVTYAVDDIIFTKNVDLRGCVALDCQLFNA